MKSLLFDFGGTLDSDGEPWLDRFYAIYKEEGVEVPRETFARAFFDSDDALASRFALRGLSLERTLSLQVGCVLEALPGSPLAFKERLVRRFLDASRAHFRRNRPLLERLGRRYRLGVVSNFYGNLDAVLESEGLRDLFGAVADSQSVGSQKPEARLFLHATKALGVEPEDCVMIGDSIPRDMRGAEGLRMSHALLSPRSERCCPAAWTLRTLPELETLLS